jgi:hypothetical protein
MDLTRLATLKQKLMETEDFGEVLSYFMDHFGGDPAFLALGESTEHPFLESILPKVVGRLCRREVSLSGFALTRLPEHQFVHGGFAAGSSVGTVLYFDDLQMGLLAVMLSLAPSDTRLVRFTGRPARTH